MATHFRQWFKHKIKSHRKQTTSDERDGEQHLQAINDHDSCPPPVTGRGEWPKIPMSAPDGVATDYGLFKTLPLELRRQILGHVFGNRTLHVDLTLDHPLIRNPKSDVPSRRDREANHNKSARRPHCGLGSDLVLNTNHPRQFRWFSCVCHRRLVRTDEGGGGPVRKERIEPCEDRCIPGHRIGATSTVYTAAIDVTDSLCYCESTDPDSSQDRGCFIGATGWLLACRQAYHDGTFILYTTNTFHMVSLPLLHNLPRVLPPHHLATITSLELVFSFSSDTLFNSQIMSSVWANAKEGASPSRSTSAEVAERKKTCLHDLCEMVPATFPNVRRLYVALQAHIVPPVSFGSEDIIADVERVVLGPVEDMFCVLGAGQGGGKKEFSLAIQKGGWQVFADRLTARDARAKRHLEAFDGDDRHGSTGGSYQEKLWKPLGKDGAGYWLRPGWNDFKTFGGEYWMFNLWGTDEFRGEF